VTTAEALSRSTRLINQEIFDGRADEEAIARGLVASTVRLIADEANMSCRGGQAALITAFQLIARMGIGVELVVPENQLIAQIPPLREPSLRAALVGLGDDLIPESIVRITPGQVEQTFVFGDSSCPEADAIRVLVGEMSCSLTQTGTATRIACGLPLGGLAAGAAAAALALEAAVPQIELAAGVQRTGQRRPSPGPPVTIDLTALFPTLGDGDIRLPEDLAIDAISAGAITNAFLAVAVWLLQTPTNVRIIDDDIAEVSNVNRCPQIRWSDDQKPKVEVLQASSTPLLRITGEQLRFSTETAQRLQPLAEHVLVGVDDIPSRWRVAEAEPKSLYVGATTNREAIVTNHHPGEPCAGCAYPHPAVEEEFVPTISFVSFWGGLLQACALLAELHEHQSARRLTVFPFALGERSWFLSHELPGGAHCAIDCSASAGARRVA
jgi:hypothetical protein